MQIEIKRNAFQKHTYLRVKRDGTIVVSTNLTTPKKSLMKFVESKAKWIEKTKQKLSQNSITQKEPPSKEEAKKLIKPLVLKYAKIMGVEPNKVSFRDARSRWGSCSAKDNLSFSTYLLYTPIEFIEYVVVHELAHIRHKNHSKEFWAEVERYLPDYKDRKNMGTTNNPRYS